MPEREETEKGAEERLEIIMTEGFEQLTTDTKQHLQEAQKTSGRINTKKSTPGHITLKVQKIKDKQKILREARGRKHLVYRERGLELHQSSLHKPRKKEEYGGGYLMCHKKKRPPA